MKFLNNINEETLIICSNDAKNKILAMHLLKPIKFMTPTEFRDNYYFKYDEEAILFLMQEYNINYEIAKEYIECIYYVPIKKYDNQKLAFLVEIYKKLNDNNLLKYNYEFLSYIKHTRILVYDVLIDKSLMEMIKDLDYTIVKREFNNYQHTIYEFDNIIDEVRYVAFKISKLIQSGVDINKIKLMNVTEDYYNTLSWIFNLHGIRINIPSKSKLICYDIVNKFLNGLDDIAKVPALLDTLFEESYIYEELFKVVNKYYRYHNLELLKYKIKNSYINSYKYNNSIDIVDYLSYISSDDEYYFMLGFNDSIIPKTVIDTDYITDDIKDMTFMENTRVLNKWNNERTIECIGDIKNLEITYKINDYNNRYYPSMLCNLYEVKKYEFSALESYSSIFDKIRLINNYDNYFKYGEKSEELAILRNNYPLKYNGYSNKYTMINRKLEHLVLSYSKMNIYNKCAFRYYLSDVLKVQPYEETFSMLIGNTIHYVMESCLKNNDLDYHKYIDEYLKDRILSKKERFFLNKYTNALGELIAEVLKEREQGILDLEMYEKSVTIPYGENIVFNGKIDKILYRVDNDNTYVAVIDYKTGNDLINLNYLNDGINIQLPIYMFLVKHMDFKNIKYVGFYLQKLNIADKDYRLEGYSNSNPDIISYLDKDYRASKIIKGLKVKNDGSFYATCKVLSDDDINKIIDVVSSNIDKVLNNIKNNVFTINPKCDYDKQIGCEYCPFSDICFHTDADNVPIYRTEFGGSE